MTAGRLVPCADRRPGADDSQVAGGQGRPERAVERRRVVRDDAPQVGGAAAAGDQRRQGDGRGIADLARQQVAGGGRHDLVAGGEDRHGGPDPDPDLADPRRGQQPEVLGAQRPPRRHEPRARRHVLVGAHHPVPGCGRAHDLDRAGHHHLRVLDHHDGVGAGREGAAGRDRHGGARPDHGVGEVTHAHRTDDVQVAGEPVRDAVRVGRPDGEPVDGRPREAGQGGGCDHVLGGDPAAARRPGRRPRPLYAVRAGTRCSASSTVRAVKNSWPGMAPGPSSARLGAGRRTTALVSEDADDRAQCHLAEAADRRPAQHRLQLEQLGPAALVQAPTGGEHLREQGVRLGGPDPAGDALAARLVAEEREHVRRGRQQVGALGHHHHGAGPEHGSRPRPGSRSRDGRRGGRGRGSSTRHRPAAPRRGRRRRPSRRPPPAGRRPWCPSARSRPRAGRRARRRRRTSGRWSRRCPGPSTTTRRARR